VGARLSRSRGEHPRLALAHPAPPHHLRRPAVTAAATSTRDDDSDAVSVAVDTDIQATLAALIGRLEAARPYALGLPAATDCDYRILAPLLAGHLLNNLG